VDRSFDTECHNGEALLQGIVEEDRREGQEIHVVGLVLSKSKVTSRMNKMKVREELKWTGEETKITETVNHFCRHWLFSKFKFLMDGWKEILRDKKNSFYSLCMRHLMIPEGADYEGDIWERVIVPSVMRKYQHMKCNLNDDIKMLYMSTTTCLCKSTFAVHYTDIYFILHLNTTEERVVVVVWPNELGKGFQDYVKLKPEHVVDYFMCTCVRRMKPDTRWKKLLTMNPGCPVICFLH